MSRTTGTITTGTGVVSLALNPRENVGSVLLHGPFGDLNCITEVSSDNGSTWSAVVGVNPDMTLAPGSDGTATLTTHPNFWVVGLDSGVTNLRVRATSLSSGTVNVQIDAGPLKGDLPFLPGWLSARGDSIW